MACFEALTKAVYNGLLKLGEGYKLASNFDLPDPSCWMINRMPLTIQEVNKTTMRIILAALVTLAYLPEAVAGQEAPKPVAWGLEAQAYPAGVNVGIRFSYGVARRDAVLGYVAYNSTDRRDWGEHFHEEGGGAGGGVAWRHYLRDGRSGPHFGVRVDLWFLEIDWRTGPLGGVLPGPVDVGVTDVVVLQPTAQGGYTLLLGDSGFQLEGTVALGAEVNVSTDGEDVGQGAILLAGVGFAYRF